MDTTQDQIELELLTRKLKSAEQQIADQEHEIRNLQQVILAVKAVYQTA